jgi:hypothetical protein
MKYEVPKVTSVRVTDVLSQLGPARATSYGDDEKWDWNWSWNW